jgi:hypothetical protein
MLVASAADMAASPIDLAPFLAMLRSQGLPATVEPLPASHGATMRPSSSSSSAAAPPAPAPADGRAAAEQRAQTAAVAAAVAVAGTGPSSSSASGSSTLAAAAAAAAAAVAAAAAEEEEAAAAAARARPRVEDDEEGAFLSWLATAPGEALAFLVRLPPTLTTLDLATKVLASATLLPSRGIEPADVAREHLQHALRFVDGLRPGSSGGGGDGEASAGSGAGGRAGLARLRGEGGRDAGEDEDDEDGRGGGGTEGQARAVALLVVYLRNLIASGVLPLDRVWLDVQEVCVRYIWLPQVREFRAWLEGSVVAGGAEG